MTCFVSGFMTLKPYTKCFPQALLLITFTHTITASEVVRRATVHGTGQNAIIRAINSACNGNAPGTVLFPTHTYTITSTIAVPANCALKGQNRRQAILSGSSIQLLSLRGDSITIDGLVFDGGLIHFAGGSSSQFAHFVFTNNTVQNYTALCGNHCGYALYAQSIKDSVIDNNIFLNLWPGGWPSTPQLVSCGTMSTDCWGPVAIQLYSIDHTVISNNIFDKIANDGIHIDFETTLGSHFPGGPYTTSGNRIEYNTFTHMRRTPIEIQTLCSGTCPDGTCSTIPPTTGLQVKGNFIHNWSFPYQTSWISIVPDNSTNGFYVNNTWIANVDPEGHAGYFRAACQETSGGNVTVQGTVCATRTDLGSSWGTGFAIGGAEGNTTVSVQNTVQCGQRANAVAFETKPPFRPSLLYQYNYLNSAVCPAGNARIDESNILAAFASSNNQTFPIGGDATWNVLVVSNLSIKWVQFVLDGAVSPTLTQELSDINTGFANDRRWLYHVAVNTSALARGAHTITAKVMDVSSAAQSVMETFCVGSCRTTEDSGRRQ